MHEHTPAADQALKQPEPLEDVIARVFSYATVCAISDIECFCDRVQLNGQLWYVMPKADEECFDDVTNAVWWLTKRGRIARPATGENLVRVL